MAYQIDNSTAATSLPTPGAVGPNPNGYFTGGTPGTVAATIVDSDWLNMVQQELINAVTSCGTTPSKTNDAQLAAVLTGRLLNVRVITTSGTYTPTTGTNSIDVEVIGGGGGGGGLPATAASQVGAAGGGGAGGYARKHLTAGFSGAAMTIGAGGAASTAAQGGAGGTTTFASATPVSATGGGGGSVGVATATTTTGIEACGSPGSGSGGDANGLGGYGLFGQYYGNTYVLGGSGGSSFLGGGATFTYGNTSIAGHAAATPGSGGGGSIQGASSAANAGGNGAAGLILIREYS